MDEQLDTLPAASVALAKIVVTALDVSESVVIRFAPDVPTREEEMALPQDESLNSLMLATDSDRFIPTCGVWLIPGDTGLIEE